MTDHVSPRYAGAEGTHEFLRDILVAFDETFHDVFGYHTGFLLLTFDFSKPGIANYASNARRKDIIIALRETAERLEKNQDIPPTIGTA